MCEFNEPKINPETGDIIMPTLRKFYLSRPGDIKLTDETLSKIKLKERLMEEYGSKMFIIDQYGWRIEKK